MNWGYKILIVIISFIAMMMAMVFIAQHQNNELIETNYYAKELAFQGVIDAAARVNNENWEPKITQENNELIITINDNKKVENINFNMELQNYLASKSDVQLQFQLINHKKTIGISTINNGRYKLKLNWQFEGNKYYFEKDMYIKK